jgi:hypothetical protein
MISGLKYMKAGFCMKVGKDQGTDTGLEMQDREFINVQTLNIYFHRPGNGTLYSRPLRT